MLKMKAIINRRIEYQTLNESEKKLYCDDVSACSISKAELSVDCVCKESEDS